jgi:hypothetical protein
MVLISKSLAACDAMVNKANKWNPWNVLSSLLSTVIALGLLQFSAWLLGVTWYELVLVYAMFTYLLGIKGAHYEPASKAGEDGSAGTKGEAGKTQ